MDRFNRLAVSLAAVVIIALSVIAILVITGGLDYWFLPWGVNEAIPAHDAAALPSNPDVEAGNTWFESELRRLAQLGLPWKALGVVAALAAIVAMMPLLVWEARGGIRRRETPLLVSATSRGTITADPASVRSLVENTGTVNRSVP